MNEDYALSVFSLPHGYHARIGWTWCECGKEVRGLNCSRERPLCDECKKAQARDQENSK